MILGHVKSTDFQETGHCMGYVTGWMDTVNEQLTCEDGRLYTLKFVGDMKVGQVIKVFLQYIDSHPEHEQELAAHVLERALGEKKMIAAVAVDFSECKQ
jgi:Ssp1 endopeptidase immunity protein Rap1a